MASNAGKQEDKREGLFDGLSMAQVVAGALAAVTSMLLASRIGIAGSVIGVAVGSVVSAIASQLYKKFLTTSAEKLRDLHPGEEGESRSRKGGETASDAANSIGTEAEGTTADQTVPLSTAFIRRSSTPHVDDDALRGDVTVERAKARRIRKKKVQRRVIGVSVASALVAAMASGLIVEIATKGQGLGTTPPSLMSSFTRDQPSTISSGDGQDEEPSADTGSSDTPDPSTEQGQNGSTTSTEEENGGSSSQSPDEDPQEPSDGAQDDGTSGGETGSDDQSDGTTSQPGAGDASTNPSGSSAGQNSSTPSSSTASGSVTGQTESPAQDGVPHMVLPDGLSSIKVG